MTPVKTFIATWSACLLLTAHGIADAQPAKTSGIKIEHPYARSTVPGQPVGGGYLVIRNSGAADKLISASAADVASSVEIHLMKLQGDVMRMRAVDAIDVGAGKAVQLQPGGYHLMLMGLKEPLKAGDHFPLKLRFEKAGEMTVDVTVEGRGGKP